MKIKELLHKLSEDKSYDVSDRAMNLTTLFLKVSSLEGLDELEESLLEREEEPTTTHFVKEEDLRDSKEDSEWLDKKFDKKSYWDKLKEKINK